ncbi:MAG: InlB B-repeat-containing protein, partial [Candidatus Coproplasma sp.]
MKRASKRLISAIIALVASVLLCIGVCLAWFAVNDNVSGNGLQTQVKGGDIVSFNVTAYYLDFKGDDKTNFIKAETGNKTINGTLEEFDKNSNGVFDISAGGNDEMRSYDPSKSYASAVLFEVSYEIKADSEKTFRIYASCSDTTEHFTVKNEFTVIKDSDPNNDIYYSSVSNSVFLSEAISEIGVYSYNSLVNKTFINGDYTKEFTKYLRTGITKENAKCTLYYIMDYDEALFNTLTNKMLNSGGTLISTLSLDGDVIFGMEEYTSAESTVTVTFNMNGHGTQIDSVETVDGKISVPTEPTAVGYTFGGWYLNADCTGTAIDFDSYTFEDNTTLYAKWTEESSGGTVATYSASVSDGTLSTTSSGVFAWGGTTALDTDNMKFSSDKDTLTITLAYLEAGQQVEITLNCMDASST